jgi:F-type H+-transporting ATPase subunit b
VTTARRISGRPRLAVRLASARASLAAAPIAAGVLLAAGAALAAEAGGEHHPPSVGLLLLNFVNFAIYAYIIYRFAWPPISKYLTGRRAAVVAELEAAQQARREAEAMKAEYEAKLRNLEADAERARAEVLAIAEVEARNLLEEARRSAERVRNDARLVAEQEVTRARRILQEEAAALVARVAGDLVAKQLTTQDQGRFVADFVAQAGETAEDRRMGMR